MVINTLEIDFNVAQICLDVKDMLLKLCAYVNKTEYTEIPYHPSEIS